ncbi:MAG: hypothetical protein AUG46_03585 [Acidobacteria bacterium 13_1_20CM_3_58_11]|nr:MAG: hypothetical protein AUG46_03585 [Acidobacteria bacterium 13_1_20CM_3_58_11]
MRNSTHLGVYSLKAWLADWKLILAMGAAAIAALAMVAYAFLRPPVNPEEEERKRRLHVNQIGRIAEGQRVCSEQARARFKICARAIWFPTVP